MIECNEINVSYTGDLVVEAVSFSIREPAIIGVIGPNGAGKSTLLKAMLAIIPHSGEVLIDGVPAKKKFETSGIRGTKKCGRFHVSNHCTRMCVTGNVSACRLFAKA
ncbi:manganese transport protein [Listeria floridensis FSL S10-1187]|uniref:Manganese transport protein n=1 Tax=Listeria floridensis FSL S10-1187 TaxID=1265817 RepID=A0ABP3AU44_9LIST|nr:manganese transport protein [Listeria floridensis FSL S10-1187]